MKLLPDPKDYSEKRLFALDFLRGVDMLILIGWCCVGQAIGTAYRLSPGYMRMFDHLWIGFTLWDFIQPLFIFVVGAAMPLALTRRLEPDGRAGWRYWKHVLSRVAMLWVLGGIVQCDWLTLDPMKMTPYGNALQTISVGYVLGAALLPVRDVRLRCGIPLALAVVYGILCHALGDYTQSGCWPVRFDEAIWRAIMPDGHPACDTHGWTRFSTTPMFLFLVSCGMEATRVLLDTRRSPYRRAGILACVGAVLMATGGVLSLFIPLIKHIYSVNFTFLAMGMCFALLAATYVVTDIWKFRRGTSIVLLWGQCALVAYFTGHVFSDALWSVSNRLFGGALALLPSGSPLARVLSAVGWVAVLTAVLVVWRLFRIARRLPENGKPPPTPSGTFTAVP